LSPLPRRIHPGAEAAASGVGQSAAQRDFVLTQLAGGRGGDAGDLAFWSCMRYSNKWVADSPTVMTLSFVVEADGTPQDIKVESGIPAMQLPGSRLLMRPMDSSASQKPLFES
jgi:hypothetical protein